MNKTEANKIINKLKDEYRVWNFSDKRSLRRGMKDFVDYVIIGKGKVYFVELKLGKDRMSEGQRETEILIKNLKNDNVHYVLLNEFTVENFCRNLIGKQYDEYTRCYRK